MLESGPFGRAGDEMSGPYPRDGDKGNRVPFGKSKNDGKRSLR